MRLEQQGSSLGKASRLDRAKAELFMQDDIRAIKDERNHLVQSSKSFLCLQILSQIVFLSFFKPFLTPIVKLPQKMCPNLVIEHSLNGSPMTTVLTASTLLWTTLVVEMVFSANQKLRNSLISNLFIYCSKYLAVSSKVKGSPCRTSEAKLISAPFSSILSARPRYSPFGLSYFMFSLYSSSIISEIFGQTKKGFFWNSLSKKRTFYFSRLSGLSSLRQVAKLVFFLDLMLSLFYFVLVYSFALPVSFFFFSSLILLRTFSLMMPSSFGYLKFALLAMTGEGVLMPDFERLFEAQCLMRILSEELGVRGKEGYRCMPSFVINGLNNKNKREYCCDAIMEWNGLGKQVVQNIFLGWGWKDFKQQQSIFYRFRPQNITSYSKENIMKYLTSARKLFKSFDLFSTSQFLRFQGEGEYKTASGGLCSLIVIAIFMALFMSTAIQTLNMQIITWSSTSQSLFDPAETVIPINPPASPFMFAIKMFGMNLNDNVRYFDITMIEREYIDGLYENTPKYVEMVPCTTQHFSLTEQIKKNTANLGLQAWLCPPIGYNFSIKGKYTSSVMKVLEIAVKKCNATKDLSRPCASDATLDYYQGLFQQFILSLNFVNPLINPGNQNYLSYYIEDVSYLKFTRKLGADSNGHIEDYTIETDVSLLPLTQKVVESGVIIPEIFQNIAFEVTNDRYSSFFFMKSARSTTYSRSFNKLDSFFSYVGGLVGTILGFMFLVANFTSMAYELDLAERICRYKEDKLNDFTNFSLLYYCIYIVYSISKLCGFGKHFATMRQADECSQEASRQLDIQLLLERLLFLQRATESLLENHQLHGLHLHRLDTLKEIKKRRKRYALRHGKQEESDSEDDSETKSNKNNSVKSNKVLPFQADVSQLQLQDQNKRQSKQQSSSNPSISAKIQDLAIKTITKLKEDTEKGNEISKRILAGIDDLVFQENLEPSDRNKMENRPVISKSIQNVDFQFLE